MREREWDIRYSATFWFIVIFVGYLAEYRLRTAKNQFINTFLFFCSHCCAFITVNFLLNTDGYSKDEVLCLEESIYAFVLSNDPAELGGKLNQ